MTITLEIKIVEKMIKDAENVSIVYNKNKMSFNL